MKRFCAITLRVFCLGWALCGFAACEQPAGPVSTTTPAPESPAVNPPAPVAPTLVSLCVASPPQTLYYARGQEFDPAGLVVEGEFSDETARELAPEEYELMPPDMSGTGPRIGTVRAGELSASFPILINNSDSVLTAIAVQAPPGGVIQYLGESLSTGAVTVMGTFTGTDGSETKPLTAFSTSGYDRAKRGPQTITVSVNGQTDTFPVTVKVPADAVVEAAVVGTDPNPRMGHDTAFIRGQSPELARARIRATVTANGLTATLYGGDGIDFDEISGFDPSTPGMQTITLDLDGTSVPLDVYVTDIEPELYFDYGFMRTKDDPNGLGGLTTDHTGNLVFNPLGDGAYHTVPGHPLVLSPVRVLIGYAADHSDLGVTYNWTVTPVDGAPSYTPASTTGEFLTFVPPGTGTWDVSVSVTGRNYVDGNDITLNATTQVICDPVPTTYENPKFDTIFNASPGQFTESGTGHGWSLGTIGGYNVTAVQHKASYTIEGNDHTEGIVGWSEPGIVWFQEDLNGNGLPDEIWYEVNAGSGPYVSRRYSVKFIKYGEEVVSNQYGQTLRDIYWADSKGRTGMLRGGWPWEWGVTDTASGAWVTYTATLMADTGVIKSPNYNLNDLTGGTTGGPYVDRGSPIIPISRAIDAAGTPVTLTNVRFVKVQTGLFQYGGVFGEISTETGFPY